MRNEFWFSGSISTPMPLRNVVFTDIVCLANKKLKNSTKELVPEVLIT